MTSTQPMTSAISVIVPTFNEEDNIPALARQFKGSGCEILLVDGGSDDATVTQAMACGLTVLSTSPGRAVQLNHGAMAAGGDILLFLHADTRLPADFVSSVRRTLQAKGCIAGAFRLAIAEPTPAMRFIAGCANLRSTLLQLPYGDQAIFIGREDFFRLGMFPELPIMEDYVFVKRARKQGRIVICRDCVVTSARRWRRLGVMRTTMINQLVVAGFHLGISPQRLARFYRG